MISCFKVAQLGPPVKMHNLARQTLVIRFDCSFSSQHMTMHSSSKNTSTRNPHIIPMRTTTVHCTPAPRYPNDSSECGDPMAQSVAANAQAPHNVVNTISVFLAMESYSGYGKAPVLTCDIPVQTISVQPVPAGPREHHQLSTCCVRHCCH